jgi:hypothetical protein
MQELTLIGPPQTAAKSTQNSCSPRSGYRLGLGVSLGGFRPR